MPMRRLLSLWVPLVLAALLAAPAAAPADEAADYRIGVVRDAHALASLHWSVRDAEGRADREAAERAAVEGAELNRRVLAGLERAASVGDRETLAAFGRFLAARPADEGEIYAPVLERVRTRTVCERLHEGAEPGRGPTGEVVILPDPGHIPGYGTADPAFLYARGATLESRVVGDFWQPRVLYLVVNEFWRGTISVEAWKKIPEKARDLTPLSGVFTAKLNRLAGPLDTAAAALKPTSLKARLGSFRMNGFWRFAVERRFDIIRTDYELWRAPKRYFLKPKWQRAGSMHLLTDRCMPEQIITGLR